MKFSEIPGHENIKQRMRDMADSGRLPHALLIEGPSGIGKLSLARAMAQYIHCENRQPNGDACGHCQPCLLHESLNHIDTLWVYPVVKLEGMNTAPVSDDFFDQWREYLSERGLYMDFQQWTSMFTKKNAQPITYVTESASLIHKLSFTSHISKQKIVIWWLPERMNDEAANKLLKMIEEPFDDTIFIMVSDNPSAILPTIYSRVQRITAKRLDDQTIAHYLISNYGIDPQQAASVAHVADGSMVRGIHALNQTKENALFLDMFIRLMRLAYQRNVKEMREWSEELAGLGRDIQIRFYQFAIDQMRENFVYNLNVPDLNYQTKAESDFSSRFARFITVKNVEKLIETFDRARTDIAGNANAKIVNLDVTIKVILLLLPK